MEPTAVFAQKVRNRFQAILGAMRQQQGADSELREAAIRATAKALQADGFFGMTEADVRRTVRDQG